MIFFYVKATFVPQFKFLFKTMKSMKDMKIDFPVYILHALHVLHGKIKYSILKFMTLKLIL